VFADERSIESKSYFVNCVGRSQTLYRVIVAT